MIINNTQLAQEVALLTYSYYENAISPDELVRLKELVMEIDEVYQFFISYIPTNQPWRVIQNENETAGKQ